MQKLVKHLTIEGDEANRIQTCKYFYNSVPLGWLTTGIAMGEEVIVNGRRFIVAEVTEHADEAMIRYDAI